MSCPSDSFSGRFHCVFTLLAGLVIAAAAGAEPLPLAINLGNPQGEEGARIQRIIPNTSTFMGSGNQSIAVGNLDGDHLDDYVVGYSEFNNGSTILGGAVFIYLGAKLATLGSSSESGAAFTSLVSSGDAGTQFGYSVALANVDDDPLDELIVGAPGSRNGRGTVHVFSAVPDSGGFAVFPNTGMPILVESRFIGVNDGDQLGYAVAGGDTTGDGKAEVVMSAPQAEYGAFTDTGKVYVYFGSLIAFNNSAQADSIAVRWEIRGGFNNQQIGGSLAMGDPTGDGYQDILIGAPFHQPNAGAAYLIVSPGQSGNFMVVTDGGVSSSIGQFIGDHLFGFSVAIGDLDGDGGDDLLFGVPGYDNDTEVDAGQAIFMYGGANLIGGYFSFFSEEPGFWFENRLYGTIAGERAGTSVAFADLNGDGSEDIIVGAPFATIVEGGPANTGKIYIDDGVYQTEKDLADADHIIYGGEANGFFGGVLAGGADIDGDGAPDLVTAAPFAVHPQDMTGNGIVYTIFGQFAGDVTIGEERHFAGNVPRAGIGPRLAPASRVTVAYTGGTNGSTESITTRNTTDIENLGYPGKTNVAGVYWYLESNRSGFSNISVSLDYSDAEIAGLNEASLVLYRASMLTGPWTSVAAMHQLENNRLIFDGTTLGYFALVADAPVITLNGDAEIAVECGGEFTDPGATALGFAGDLTGEIVVGGDTVNPNFPAVYVITYDVMDGNNIPAQQLTRTVTVADTLPPNFELAGDDTVTIECGDGFNDPGTFSYDQCEGVLDGHVVVGGDTVQTGIPGSYVITYDVQDALGHAAPTLERTVIVQDTINPVIQLDGAGVVNLACGASFTDPGATASDDCSGSLTGAIIVSGDTVDTNTQGSYVIIYNVVDGAGRSATPKTRVVNVGACVEGQPDGEGEGQTETHAGDYNGNGFLDFPELLRIIQHFNSGGFGCRNDTEDGFEPRGSNTSCTPHALDYNPQNWKFEFTEVLRGVQFYNSGGVYACPGMGTEDGYCPGQP